MSHLSDEAAARSAADRGEGGGGRAYYAAGTLYLADPTSFISEAGWTWPPMWNVARTRFDGIYTQHRCGWDRGRVGVRFWGAPTCATCGHWLGWQDLLTPPGTEYFVYKVDGCRCRPVNFVPSRFPLLLGGDRAWWNNLIDEGREAGFLRRV